ncbi:MAG: N-acetyltransferase [Anaerolineales bacterium]|nr:N-acetyltransferase [Anaerolineales bacterium]
MVQEVSMDVLIRSERPTDIAATEQVTLAAFMGKFSDNPTEHLIVNGLRDASALSLSLVAEVDRKIVGHVAFSAVTINGENLNWYGLGPISVVPELQKQGIGSKLIHEGLSAIRSLGAKGCVLEGSPVYYQRFGFKSYLGLIYEGSPAPEYFMALPFYEEVPQGKVEYHQAFYIGM